MDTQNRKIDKNINFLIIVIFLLNFYMYDYFYKFKYYKELKFNPSNKQR
ncbi:hypothetical protein LEP1GSC170_4335 [Leptospira interrogans serovar Bataviae str. HAI135]|nr:hypothetical protein LEP1GSC170_4335 [Leptospira interrogans serovar Bataviae str. HAI135]